MLEIEINLTLQDEQSADPLLDAYETDMLLQSTQIQLRQHIESRLAEMTCDEHHEAPKVKVTAVYSRQDEQIDVEYHVDTCCKALLVRSVAALSR